MQYQQDNQTSNKDELLESQKSKPEKLKVTIIETPLSKQRMYSSRIRGHRSETKQLNIHVKTLTEKLLKKCAITNELTAGDKEIVKKYRDMKANFDSSHFLHQHLSQQAKQLQKNYILSSDIVKDILLSQRMFINNKLIFIKFLKKLESGIYKPNVSWKQQYFKNKKKTINKTKRIQRAQKVGNRAKPFCL